MLDKIEDFRLQQQLDQIQEISAQLAAGVASDIATLEERIFVEVFLPLFAGDVKLPYPVSLTTWTNYAGSPYRAVNVIDLSGKVLFTVPALYDRTAINPVSDAAIPISHIVATASQYARIHPSQGLYYLDAQLSKRALVMKVPSNVIEDLTTWNAIFVRYNRTPIMALNTQTSDLDEGDTLEYEFEPM